MSHATPTPASWGDPAAGPPAPQLVAPVWGPAQRTSSLEPSGSRVWARLTMGTLAGTVHAQRGTYGASLSRTAQEVPCVRARGSPAPCLLRTQISPAPESWRPGQLPVKGTSALSETPTCPPAGLIPYHYQAES